MAEQVAEGQDAQLLEPLGSLGADALEIAYRGVRREGGDSFYQEIGRASCRERV